LVGRGVGVSCDDEQKQNVRMLNMEVEQTKNDLAIANRDKNFMKKKLQDKNALSIGLRRRMYFSFCF